MQSITSLELAETKTVKAAHGQLFPQKVKLALVRQNYGAIMS